MALVGADRQSARDPVCLLGFRTQPYPRALRQALRACARRGSSVAVARLNVAVGEFFATAILRVLEETRTDPHRVTCIGSHGQTLVHLPRPRRLAGYDIRASLQIGEPAIIAERTGITTVADFRTRDLAAGGEGAPLVPLLDYLLYRHPERGRVLVNIGGIANLSALPPGASQEELLAFDTGPGNVLLDAVARQRRMPRGRDEGGQVALSGEVCEQLLRDLLRQSYFRREPPKSADVGEFLRLLPSIAEASAGVLSTADRLRTLAELTAATIVTAIVDHVQPGQPVDDVIVAGGGIHNQALMAALQKFLSKARLPSAEVCGAIAPDAKEAVAFAVLGLETLAGRPGNLPSATGAVRAVVLGKVLPGR